MKSNIAVVICGYDDYAPLWSVFKHSIEKYWYDCPWPKYFITNHLNSPEGFINIKVGKEIDWGDKVITALSRIDAEIIVWMMEDFWLTGHVQTQVLKKYSELMSNEKRIAQIRLLCPFNDSGAIIPEKEFRDQTDFDRSLWWFKDDAEYRASVSITMWRKDKLLKYLRDGMSPWSFEQEASILSSQYKDEWYLGIINPFVFPLCHVTNPYQGCSNDVVTKGRWNYSAYEYIKKENLLFNNFKYHPNGTLNQEYNKWIVN